jgi:hypothetical protein
MVNIYKLIKKILLIFFSKEGKFIKFILILMWYFKRKRLNLLKNFFLKMYIIFDFYNNKKAVSQFLDKIKIIGSSYEIIRIGDNEDGGYLCPNILNQIKFNFSPGVGYLTSFEDHLLNYNIKSYLADGTVNYEGNHDFLQKNLNTFNDEKNITLDDWVNDKVKSECNDLMLQMDIEGCELEVLYHTNILDRFKIIIIEFHHFHNIVNKLGLKIYNDIFDKIFRTHQIFHIHPNNASSILRINGINIPDMMEITFINNKISTVRKKVDYELPHKLDRKNMKYLSDIKCPEKFYK